MRLIVFILVFIFSPIAPLAIAGDFAFEQVIGFSKDGRYFGFEEYGIQNGSGFAYSHIFIVDLETDTFVPSTPVRILTKTDSASLETTRWQARKNARNLLRKYKLHNPATLIFARGLGDLANTDKGLSARLTSRIVIPAYSDPTRESQNYFDLVMSHIPAPSIADCPVDTIGFLMEKINPNGKRRFVHRDEKIFKSRGCPLKYRISRVYTPFGEGEYAVVMISVFQVGFEGPDRRFIVLPVRYR